MIGDIANTVKIMELILKVGLSITDYKLMHGEKRLWNFQSSDGRRDQEKSALVSPLTLALTGLNKKTEL